MTRFGAAILLSMTLVLLACGGGTNHDVIQGNWKASVLNPDGTSAFNFTATLTQTGSTVTVTNLSFVNPSTCFAEGTTATGTFTFTGTTHGVTSGAFQMTIQSGPSNPNGTNALALPGTFVRNAISGAWGLTGTGLDCSTPEDATSGSFTMVPM